ncbi:MAG: hypothetical protein N2036_03600 [Bryobacteraceae bacterium]|nr:hypothetical protein [Bryobacteraceae bacterium]
MQPRRQPPTFAALARARLPENLALDGLDPGATLRHGAPSPRRGFFHCLEQRFEAVRRGPWRCRHASGSAPQLLHLERDPSEKYGVRAREPESAARLREFARETGAETAA